MNNLVKFGVALKKFLKEHRELLADGAANWTRGGCLELAMALRKFFGPRAKLRTVVCLKNDGSYVHACHAYVSLPEGCVDGDGLNSEQWIIDNIAEYHHEKDEYFVQKAEPFKKQHLENMDYKTKNVNKILKALKKEFGSWDKSKKGRYEK